VLLQQAREKVADYLDERLLNTLWNKKAHRVNDELSNIFTVSKRWNT
jgi:hypothetical protein